MSKIDELLKNEKVEWKKLWEVTIWDKKFNGVEKYKQKKVIKYHYYLAKELKNLIHENGNIKILTTNATNIYALEEEVKDNVSYGEIVCIPWGGNPIVQYYKGGFITGDNRIATSVNKEILDNKFLYYFLLNNIDYISSLYRGSGIKHPDMYKVLDMEIPIPSIKTQEKIVKILDKFTNYVTELQSELQARNKQYEYYRDTLLSEEYLKKLSEDAKMWELNYKLNSTTLGDIGKFTRGNGLQKKDFISKGKPVIHYGQIYTKFNFETDKTISFVSEDVFSKLKKAKFNDILIATTSENIEDVGKCVVWLGNEEIGFSGDMYSYSTKENPKYIAYYFQTNKFQKQKEQKVTGTKLIRIHGDDMAKFSITLPPRSIQNKVVEVLDKFQDLLSDTQGLLPEEIEQRQKQYEYYREKLLTFEDSSGSTPHAARRTPHAAK